MLNFSLVNILGACLIITSMSVVSARRGTTSAMLYALQSFVLVGILFTLGTVTGSTELYMWSVSAFITKVVLVPSILLFTLKKIGDSVEVDLPPKLSPMKCVALVVVIMAFVRVITGSVLGEAPDEVSCGEVSCAYPVATCARCGRPYASAKEIDYAKRILARAGGVGAGAVSDAVFGAGRRLLALPARLSAHAATCVVSARAKSGVRACAGGAQRVATTG